MAKVFLIGGVARSGKSILQQRILKEHNISGLGTDVLRAMLEYGSDSIEASYKKNPETNLKVMSPFLEAFIDNIIDYSDKEFVLEGDVLLPSFLERFQNNELVRSCFLGYADAQVDKKFQDIRNHHGEIDWSVTKDDKSVRDFVDWGIGESKKYREQCQKLGIKYFEISEDFEKCIDSSLKFLFREIGAK